MVEHRMEDVIMLGIASVAALIFQPLTPVLSSCSIKAKVATVFGNLLCQPSMSEITSDYLLLLVHPGTCITQLKVASTYLCFLSLFSFLSGKFFILINIS